MVREDTVITDAAALYAVRVIPGYPTRERQSSVRSRKYRISTSGEITVWGELYVESATGLRPNQE